MKALITGAEGMLGRAFTKKLKAGGWQVAAFNHCDLDVVNAEVIPTILEHKPHLVVHCAAYTKVDKAEQDQELCWKVNVDGTRNIAIAAQKSAAKLIYPQTFLVFGESSVPLVEDAPENPLSYYAYSKSEGEKCARSECENILVIRKGGLFGGEEQDKNFVGSMAARLIAMVKAGQTSLEIGNRIWQPTWASDVADWTLQLLELNVNGRFNMASRGEASFYETAVAIRDALGLNDSIELQPIDASILASRELAKRPMKATLDCSQIQEALKMELPFWKDRLVAYLSLPYFSQLKS